MLGRHLGALWANTKHRNPSDDPEVRKLATHRMVVMLMEYPERVALSAIDRWPQTEGGEWFPTEAELRGVCVAIQRAMRPPPPQPSSPAPEMPRSEREHMKLLLKGLTLAMAARNGREPDLTGLSKVTVDEYRRLRALYAERDAADRKLAHDAGYSTVRTWLARKNLQGESR